jgi:hypothetical protein
LSSHFVLAFLAFKIVEPSEVVRNPINPQLFFGLGLIAIIASFVIPSLLKKSLKLPLDQMTVEILFTPFIFSLALNEACAIMGFLTKVHTNNDQISSALFLISLIVYLSRFPTESKLKSEVEVMKNMKAK